MQVTIRPFDPQFLEAVVALSLRAWEPVFRSVKTSFDPDLYDYFYPDWRQHQEKDVKKVCSADDSDTWIACIDDQVAGFVSSRLNREEKTGEIYMLAVDPDYQRQGISSQLIDFVTGKMKDAGMEICMLSTGGDPGHRPARMAYEQSGFKPWESVIYFKKL